MQGEPSKKTGFDLFIFFPERFIKFISSEAESNCPEEVPGSSLKQIHRYN
jgi:hypothetical protein